MEIWKEKQFIYILRTGAKKPYILDLEKGHLIGMNNLPLKMVSTALTNECYSWSRASTDYFEKSVAYFIYSLNNICGQYVSHSSNLKYYKFFNALISINSEQAFNLLRRNHYNVRYLVDTFHPKTMKHFLKDFSLGNIDVNNFDVRDYLDTVSLKEVKKYFDKSHIHFTEAEKKDILCVYRSLTEEEFKIFFYLAERKWLTVFEVRTIGQKVRAYCRMCQELNIKPKKEKDMIMEMARVKYLRMEQDLAISDKKLQSFLLPLKEKLFFENEQFTVIVPTTKQEFLDEGLHQNNCVARLYLPKVEEGETIIVFVRKKEDVSHSYITCEIDKHTGYIKQFLLKNNSWTQPNSQEENFRAIYQEYLMANLHI